MITQHESPAHSDIPLPIRTSQKWRWIAAGAALSVAIAAGVVASASIGGSVNALDSQRVAATQNACQQWLDGYSTSQGATPYHEWCDDMGHWMNEQIGGGSVTGSMMWSSPEALTDACRQWVDTASAGDPTAAATRPTLTEWCGQMVAWMSQHMGNWTRADDWDHHMGDGHWGRGMSNR